MTSLTIIQFCERYQVQPQFAHALLENGLVSRFVSGDSMEIDDHQWPQIERWVRLHQDLHINIEGLAASEHLLQKVQQLQTENLRLRSRLRIYELD